MDNFLLNNFTIKELFDASKGALGKLFIKDEDFPTKKQERYRNFNIEENRKEILKDFNRKALFCKPNLDNY